MKVTHINTQDYGGAAKACIRINSVINSKGILSKVLVLHKTNNNDDVIEYIPKTHEYLLNIIPKVLNKITSIISKKTSTSFSLPFTGFKLKNNKDYIDSDIINLHWVSFFIDYKKFFKNNKKIIVWTLHDMNPFTGGNHYSFNNKILSLISNIILIYKIHIFSKNKLNLTIVSPSKWLLEKSKNSPTFKKFMHFHIPNPINTNIFRNYEKNQSRKDLGIEINKKVILFVSDSLKDKRKGFRYLIESLDKISDEKIQVITIGSNFDQTIKGLDIKNFGHIKDENLMAKIYSSSDLFVIPSLEDNLPNTILESISCGTPVVGFKVGGIPEIIENESIGLLCEKIDSLSLSQTIKKALNTKFDPEKIRSYTVERFGEDVIAKKYIELYENLNNNSKL